MGFFFERVQLRVYSTLSDVLYVILKVFRSSTTLLYIGQKNMHPKKSYDILEFSKPEKANLVEPQPGQFFDML
jgi:hypothetical protein